MPSILSNIISPSCCVGYTGRPAESCDSSLSDAVETQSRAERSLFVRLHPYQLTAAVMLTPAALSNS